MATQTFVVRELNTLSTGGDDIINKIGSSEDYVLVDGGTKTLKQKLADIAISAYTHPAGAVASKTAGLYKISTDATSHIASADPVVKADITALGIPAQDTVYTHPAGDAPDEVTGFYKFSTDEESHIKSITPVTKSDLTALGVVGTQYTHPEGDAAEETTGFYKFETDETSHIKSVTPVTKSDITGLGIPDTTSLDTFLKGLPTWDDVDYKLTFKTAAGTTLVVDFPIESLAKDLAYDSDTKEIVLTTQDDTEIRVPVGDFVQTYTGSTGTYIDVTIGSGNKIQAALKVGSIGKTLLDQGIQDSLDLADTALQPTDIKAWAKAANKPTYSLDEVLDVGNTATEKPIIFDDEGGTVSTISTTGLNINKSAGAATASILANGLSFAATGGKSLALNVEAGTVTGSDSMKIGFHTFLNNMVTSEDKPVGLLPGQYWLKADPED